MTQAQCEPIATREDSTGLLHQGNLFNMSSYKPARPRENPPPHSRDEDPLLRLLVLQATRRGDTLVALAKALGVTYTRVAQLRRGEASFRTARRSVHLRAAGYLGVPSVLVLAWAGVIDLEDFVWPASTSLNARLDRELERMRRDPFFGAFVPAALAAAPDELRLFVAFLYREVRGDDSDAGKRSSLWLASLQRAMADGENGAVSQPQPAQPSRPDEIF